ncbi:hypothetical protein Dimus_000827 [Dionaea muscipula]
MLAGVEWWSAVIAGFVNYCCCCLGGDSVVVVGASVVGCQACTSVCICLVVWVWRLYAAGNDAAAAGGGPGVILRRCWWPAGGDVVFR